MSVSAICVCPASSCILCSTAFPFCACSAPALLLSAAYNVQLQLICPNLISPPLEMQPFCRASGSEDSTRGYYVRDRELCFSVRKGAGIAFQVIIFLLRGLQVGTESYGWRAVFNKHISYILIYVLIYSY